MYRGLADARRRVAGEDTDFRPELSLLRYDFEPATVLPHRRVSRVVSV